MNKTLYIIGNGFDLAHGIKSSYYNFYEYLSINELSIDKEIYPQLASGEKPRKVKDILDLQIYFDTDSWNEFEEQLSNFEVPYDIIEQVKESRKSLESYSSGDIDFGVAPGFINHYTNQYIKSVNHIKGVLYKWIKQTSISCKKKYKFEDHAFFLSFNYTKTLEKIYEIDKNKICHIHGKVGDSDLIIGHSWRCEKRDEAGDEESRYLSIEENNQGLEEKDKEQYIRNESAINEERLESNIKEAFRENVIALLEKKTSEIIKNNYSFFSELELENISKIVIIGHSLSKVDMPYFKVIKDIVPKETVWCVGCYDKSAYSKADDFKNTLKIGDSEFQKFNSSAEFDLTNINVCNSL